ncbi:hypothetical protein QCA50_006915 [Cerrena zonata]|uniref:Uncharacterized protein n=1 Tax=Cerrena zonata TaxID=2478898 RepID=A0AAW0GGG2_9APHY
MMAIAAFQNLTLTAVSTLDCTVRDYIDQGTGGDLRNILTSISLTTTVRSLTYHIQSTSYFTPTTIMGRSAKVTMKYKKSSLLSGTQHQSKAVVTAPQEQKKKANLKSKATKRKEGDGPVLGGADYVSLMMGSRKKARQEAAKLPKEDA